MGLRKLVWRILKFFLFKLDAETAHLVTARLLTLGIDLGGFPLRMISGASRGSSPSGQVWGMSFQSRLGLAAGFDKNAEFLEGLSDLGFGFAEIGTVTPRPQPGNPRPRLFRKPEEDLLFNRMGFNSLGAEIVSKRLESSRKKLPSLFRVGVNIGKNKETALDEAAGDYARAIERFNGLADYVVINVSSPNTAGLRSLQTVGSLDPIMEAVEKVISKWSTRPPLLLKLAPELDEVELSKLVDASKQWNLQGWVLTNTLARIWSDGIPGGVSGAPLVSLSRERLVQMKRLSSLPIISVGGIMSASDAAERIKLGADLIQIYSSWVLRGPQLPVEITRKIRQI
jgi:dihydroorotate dehydrogenase